MADNFYINAFCYGNNIFYTGINNGVRGRIKVPYKPKVYVPSKEDSPYKTIYGESLSEISPGNIKETRDFIKQYGEIDNFKIYGNSKFEYCYIHEQYPNDVEYDISKINIAIVDIENDSNPETGGFAKPENPFQPITSITLKYLNEDKFYQFSTYKEYKVPYNVKYYYCESETELCRKFIDVWSRNHPDIISGWNIDFDIGYIVSRFSKILTTEDINKLSPWGIVKYEIKNVINDLTNKSEEKFVTRIFGVSQMDYLSMYKKHYPGGASKESYKLDNICEDEISENKLEYEGSLYKLWQEDKQNYLEYNLKDVWLVEKLDKKCRLFELILMLAYFSKTNYEDTFKQTRMWDSLIYGVLREKNIQVPQERHDNVGGYSGAFVKNPIVGYHKWVVSLDATSLYPSIIMGKNISPETIVDEDQYTPELKKIKEQLPNPVKNLLDESIDLSLLKDCNVTLAGNGHFFRTDKKGFLPEIVEKYFNKRVLFKKEKLKLESELEKYKSIGKDEKVIHEYEYKIAKYDTMQWAIKIFLNSLYGSIGNRYFRFFDLRMAEGITNEGQLSIQWAEKHINLYLNKILKTDKDYVIACDTDSLIIYLSDLVNKVVPDEKQRDISSVIKFLAGCIDKKIQPQVNDICERLSSYLNSYENRINFKVEKICSAGIWTAKKRYALNVYSNEGVVYSTPKIKVTGLEVVKSSSPKLVRSQLKQCISIILNEDESTLQKYVQNCKEKFYNSEIYDIAFPRGINGLDTYTDSQTLYKKGTPIHVRGSLVYNNFLTKNKLNANYELIKNGDKIKFCYLKMPNPFRENVISFNNNIPKELDVVQYIDYNKMFDKVFTEPLLALTDAIGWKIEKENSLFDFWE